MNYASSVALYVRRVTQKFGLTRPLARVHRMFAKSRGEDLFGQQFLGAIRPGDTVWDVGANVGFYTKQLARIVGEMGLVVAFEPAPATLTILRDAVSDLPNVHVLDVALANRTAEANFYSSGGGDPTGGLTAEHPSQTATKVSVRCGNDYCQTYSPNVIKIDVEGYELEAIHGMWRVLHEPGLRAVFVEVHFRMLNERQLENAPREIIDRLTMAGFESRWVDRSHIVATRAA